MRALLLISGIKTISIHIFNHANFPSNPISVTIYISPELEQAIKQSWRLGTTSLLNRHYYQE